MIFNHIININSSLNNYLNSLGGDGPTDIESLHSFESEYEELEFYLKKNLSSPNSNTVFTPLGQGFLLVLDYEFFLIEINVSIEINNFKSIFKIIPNIHLINNYVYNDQIKKVLSDSIFFLKSDLLNDPSLKLKILLDHFKFIISNEKIKSVFLNDEDKLIRNFQINNFSNKEIAKKLNISIVDLNKKITLINNKIFLN